MATYNQDRFFYNKYDRALELFKAGDKIEADDACRGLVTDFRCPRFVQIQAWQLRSLCTIDYNEAKAMLGKALAVCDGLVVDDRVKKKRAHTEAMLYELEGIWQKRWFSEGGMEAPEVEAASGRISEKGDDVDEEEKEAHDGDDTHGLLEQYQQMQISDESSSGSSLPEELKGGSTPFPQLPGGYKKPWLKAADGQSLTTASIISDAPLPPFVQAMSKDMPADLPPLPISPASTADVELPVFVPNVDGQDVVMEGVEDEAGETAAGDVFWGVNSSVMEWDDNF